MRLNKRLAAVIFIVCAVSVAGYYKNDWDFESFAVWIESLGNVGVVAFIVMYALASVFFLPGSIFTLVGGALFGPLWGTLINVSGATLGATLAFITSRYIAADWAEKKSGSKLRQLKYNVELEGWRTVAITRLIPALPFNLLNYALGLTRIKLSHYMVATWVFMLPGGFAYTYLGHTGNEMMRGNIQYQHVLWIVLIFVALLVFLPRIVRNFMSFEWITISDLESLKAAHEDLILLDVRTQQKYSSGEGHIPGSLNIPLENIQKSESLPFSDDVPVLLVCSTHNRSAKAANLLKRAGFNHLYVLAGGMQSWNAEQGLEIPFARSEG